MIAECVAYAARMPAWLTTTLGRVYLAVTALVLALLGLKLLALNHMEDPSLGLSLLRNSTSPLLAISFALAWAARGRRVGRDHITLAVALTTAVTISAAGVAVDQRFDAADALLAATGPLLGLTVVAFVWSGLARRPQHATS